MAEHGKGFEALLTIKQVAKIETVSERTVRRWIGNCELPVIRTGRTVRIRPQDLRDFQMRRLSWGTGG